jgi:hypothetical protein
LKELHLTLKEFLLEKDQLSFQSGFTGKLEKFLIKGLHQPRFFIQYDNFTGELQAGSFLFQKEYQLRTPASHLQLSGSLQENRPLTHHFSL